MINTRFDIKEKTVNYNEQIKNALNYALGELAINIYDKVIKNAPTAFGNLKASFDIVKISEGNLIGYKVGTPLEGGYASYVEFGTRPHTPPFEPIRQWVEIKVQPHVKAVAVEYKSGKVVPKKSGHKVLKGASRESEIRKVAGAIWQSIRRHGTKGQYYMMQSLMELGLKFNVVKTNTEIYYDVDAIDWVRTHITGINMQ